VKSKDLLNTIRNTTHAAGMQTFLENKTGEPQKILIDVPQEFRDDIIEASDELGGLEKWGLEHRKFNIVDSETEELIPSDSLSIEPYTYANQLVKTWFDLIDKIAEYTEVEK
jgi:hypothetical protein